jgi:endogenous inhibitor of DNA gyrase (YacG/DUF329 family)
MSEKTIIVPCPRCRKSTRYDPKNPFRPFCSALCKNEDIIAWAQEDYRIAGKPASPDGREVGDSDIEMDEDELN